MVDKYALMSGETLGRGQPLTRGPARMWIQTDGNLVITVDGKSVWATHTAGADQLEMKSNGDLVLRAGGKIIWAASSYPGFKLVPGALLDLLPSGAAVIYSKVNGTGLWNSMTKPGANGRVRSSPKPSLLPDPFKMLKGLGSTAKDLVHLKVQKAVKDLGSTVNQVTGSQIIQAGWPTTAVANVVNGAVTGGKSGAMKAARSFLKNPVAKATYAAVGVVLPPLAPVTAGMVAGMEAANRLLDGLESKDPQKIAAAALQLASTEAQAASGIPGAARALDIIKKTGTARGLSDLILKGDAAATKAATDLKKKASSGDAKALAAHHVLQANLIRKANQFKKTMPSAKKIADAAKKEVPSLAALVRAAQKSPKGVRLGNYAVLHTGRVTMKGKPFKHESRHKSKKAYDAYLKAHHRHV